MRPLSEIRNELKEIRNEFEQLKERINLYFKQQQNTLKENK